MGKSISSYSHIRNLGHPEVATLLEGPVVVEEKVDGSQFSFCRAEDGTFRARSKGKELFAATDEKLFSTGYSEAEALDLRPGLVYRCEYLSKPKHNALAYDRVPAHHLIVYDIDAGNQSYMSPAEKRAEAERIGLECVPVMLDGALDSFEQFDELLKLVSVLGGQNVEGVVVKNYARFFGDGKTMMGKHVSERFKEIHGKAWRDSNPTNGDVLARIAQALKTEARWDKALLHLRERGEIEGSPRDIGRLIKEVPEDVVAECRDEIVDELMRWAWPKIRRQIVAGLPEWYKERLARAQFA